MESSLSHLLAELTMDMIENKLEMPKLYLRYVGEVFAIFDSSKSADEFFDKGEFYPTWLEIYHQKICRFLNYFHRYENHFKK